MSHGQEKKRGVGLLILLRVLICAALLGAAFFGWQLWKVESAYKEAEDNYTIIQSSVLSEEEQHLVIDWEALKKQVPDVVAWIESPGTEISYPIVQGENNDYYLHRLPDGTYNKAGSIFLDYRCKADLSELNTVIYGHNMKNGSMFGSLKQYANQEYYNNHPALNLYMPEITYNIELLAGYVQKVNSDYELPLQIDEAGSADYVNNALSKSTFTSNSVYEQGNRIITLVSCTPSGKVDERYFLLGKLIEQKQEK